VHLERRQLVFNNALETSGIAVVLADAEGNVLLTNGVADELLAHGNGLSLVRGKLRAQTTGETTKLLDRVRANAAEQAPRSDWSVFSPLSLQREDAFLPLTVIVRPGPAYYPLKEPLRRTAMLIVRDPGRQAIISATTLAQLFGLSPAESLLASELASGASLEEAAASLGVSRNTVRSQLQSVFQKTGTNRQVELVRVLLSSAATAG
jgi:DNA-binding CsgD family transcriptional regulator